MLKMLRSLVVFSCMAWLGAGSGRASCDGNGNRAGAGTETVGVALLFDGPSRQAWDHEEIFCRELLDLTRGEMNLQFVRFPGDWTRAGLLARLESAYADPEIDMVMVTGLVANQILGSLESYPKPTFLPLVADARLYGLPREGRGSGKENLAYLSDRIDFRHDLENFLELVSFRKLAILADAIVFGAVDRIQEETRRVAGEEGIELVAVPYSDPEGDLLSLVPEDVEAVMIDGLARLSEKAVDRLIDGLIRRRLPSFSLMGPELVRRGMLVTNGQEDEIQRLARRNALAMQAVMLGEPAAEQPVDFDTKRRFLINLSTARQIDVWPKYRTLVEAQLVDAELGQEAPPLSLAEVAHEALLTNLDLLDRTYGVEANAEQIREARANLLPQISGNLSGSQINSDNIGVVTGAAAERSLSGSVTVSQLLFSETVRANLDIQRQLHRSRLAELDAFRLDTVQTAVIAFLEILRAETQYRVQRDNLERTQTNLELARDRVRVGSSYIADVYRWESELAAARQNAINTHAQRVRARENLNRILHRPLTDPLNLTPPTLDDGQVFTSSDELQALIDNPKGFRLLTEILVERGLELSPELLALRDVITAKEREILANRRSFYLPEVALQGQLSEVLAEDRPVGTSLEAETDWSLGLSATLPLFQGGARRARVVRTELELEQLETRLESAREAIEQNIRSNAHLANASYANIVLAAEGAEAAAKNLELVVDAYGEGALDILQLLDAQSSALQSEEAAANAVYNFLVDLLNLNRAVGSFEIFLGPEERRELLTETIFGISKGQTNEN